MLKKLSFLVLIIFSLGCAKKTSPSKSSSVNIEQYTEDISHLLPKFDLKPNKEEVKESTENLSASTLIIEDDNTKVDAVFNKIVERNKNYINSQGFRIQIFSGISKSDFENAKSFLLRNYPELEIYESYSQPTYRIKVGDFIHRTDANKYIGQLKQRFGTPRIINDKINVKKALNIK